LSQIEINQRASERAQESQKEPDALLERVNPGRINERLKTAQAVWTSYAESEATFLSRMDMEQHELKGLIVDTFLEMIARFAPTGWLPGIALQAYAPDTPGIVERVIRSARDQQRKLGIRLVKGAYWDTEVALAAQRNWPLPVFTDKASTDAQYEALTALLFAGLLINWLLNPAARRLQSSDRLEYEAPDARPAR